MYLHKLICVVQYYFNHPKPFTMKTQFSIRPIVIGIIVVIALTTFSYADAKKIVTDFTSDLNLESREDTSIVFKPMVGNKNLKLNNISMKVMRDFLLRFNNVNNATWYKEEGGFIAKFTTGTIATSVTYKKDGQWLYTISSYDEKEMPEDIKALVKNEYHDYSIVNIRAVQVPRKDSTIFLVYIQNATNIKELRVCDSEMEVLHDYIRG